MKYREMAGEKISVLGFGCISDNVKKCGRH